MSFLFTTLRPSARKRLPMFLPVACINVFSTHSGYATGDSYKVSCDLISCFGPDWICPRCEWKDKFFIVRTLPRTQEPLFRWKIARKGKREGENMVPCALSPVTCIRQSPLPCEKQCAWGGFEASAHAHLKVPGWPFVSVSWNQQFQFSDTAWSAQLLICIL